MVFTPLPHDVACGFVIFKTVYSFSWNPLSVTSCSRSAQTHMATNRCLGSSTTADFFQSITGVSGSVLVATDMCLVKVYCTVLGSTLSWVHVD